MPLEGIQSPDVPARTYKYSDDGRLYAYVLPTWFVPRRQDIPIKPTLTFFLLSFFHLDAASGYS